MNNAIKQTGKGLRNFFVPHEYNIKQPESKPRVVAIVPSFKPSKLTVRLVKDLLRWNKDISVYVVDDATPKKYKAEHLIFDSIRTLSPDVVVLRTPRNKMKAGAINFALSRILKEKDAPDVVMTFDDDVVISKNVVKNLVNNLFEDDSLGAVCSQCRVINKNKNLLTRLQGLEYLGFNGLRLADEGFFRGPLVMHGMLTAFKTKALQEVGKFSEKHLIEDYDMTAKIKSAGWHVRLSPSAHAWTQVPEDFNHLWRQRTRWMVGGLYIAMNPRYWRVIIQDIIGHALFLSTLILVILSFILRGDAGSTPYFIFIGIITVSLLQMIIWYSFQLWFMRFYLEKDWKDWLIRVSLIPEFIYANILAIALMGSYLFFIFQDVSSRIESKYKSVGKTKAFLEKIFAYVGYTKSWGTRNS